MTPPGTHTTKIKNQTRTGNITSGPVLTVDRANGQVRHSDNDKCHMGNIKEN